ncbi:F-box domain [Arabidopsis thaliana x Arabidopsis arenosa]|uniref:F-box domain n=1 Tax=Arabidopsis thaliana x Arabidopsis arenosa TaxID=1240361 RepID=A0A8T2B2E4_9BRAS|nr:F-box domain [Arabidopsis thaliana x Arabidopsis arenosa]
MAIMSDLPRDLLAEILCRVPLTSLRAVRFTCKKWNDLSKDRSFIEKQIVEAKKKQLKAFAVIMMRNCRVYLTSVDLHSDVDPSFTPKGTLISLNDDANPHQIDNVSRVFHCDGLLLCITKDLNSRLVVLNPYFGQTRWIKPRNSYHIKDNYALGYDEKKNHKILRLKDNYYAYSSHPRERICEFELYSFESNSWKVVLDVSPDWYIHSYHRGLSLKGNTYWYAIEKHGNVDFLICFDFTTERFGPRLPLPFNATASPTYDDVVTLSSVGEEQLAVLFQSDHTLMMEIWVTSKVEPTEVLWNKLFLAVDMIAIGSNFQCVADAGSFFIDQEKNVVVVFDRDMDATNTRGMAYIFGKNGHLKRVDLGEDADPWFYLLVCSYVPSSVQIRQLT